MIEDQKVTEKVEPAKKKAKKAAAAVKPEPEKEEEVVEDAVVVEEEEEEASPEPETATDDETDYSAMPLGKQKGKKWGEFDIETLKIIVAQGGDNGISEFHVAAANAVLGEMIGVE